MFFNSLRLTWLLRTMTWLDLSPENALLAGLRPRQLELDFPLKNEPHPKHPISPAIPHFYQIAFGTPSMNIYIKLNEEKSGPFTRDELQEKIYSGAVPRTVPACMENSTEWVPLETLLHQPPPLRAQVMPPQIVQASLEHLRDPKEKTALLWLYLASIPGWIMILVLLVSMMGIPLIFIGLYCLIHMIGEMWFLAHLKTNAVRVSEQQLPELNRAVDACCRTLGMARPEVYVMQQNMWNAFAAKMLGRRMVVLLSGAVDSILLKGDLQQLTWVVGHELGHHWAGHLNFSRKLAKVGSWVFWLELWYSRRAEFTCDRVGLYCTGSLPVCQLALMNLTVGAQMANRVNVAAAVEQWRTHRSEFFVKYRTLYSTHPHLLARLDHLNLSAKELGLVR